MKENPQNKNEKINKKDVKEVESQDIEMKKGFFKKVWYAVNKIEKYSELSAEGFGKAIKYLVTLVILLAVLSSGITIYKTSIEVKNIANYIDEKAPELTYNNEVLTVESQEPIIDENSNFGKVIIDTNTEDEEKINQYLNDVNDATNAIIILKNKMILKEIGLQGTTNYNYKELFGEMGITEFNKQDLVNYLSGSNMTPLYLNLFLVLCIYAFTIYLINSLFNIITISIFGYLATMILKLKIRYVAVFNMAVYAITFPTILDMIYIAINAVFRYNIKYFDVMYILVASIYMIASIFILKSDFNKKQGEVQKIVEIQKEVKEKMEEKERQEESKKENKEENKKTGKEDKKEEQEEPDEGTPEGSNA